MRSVHSVMGRCLGLLLALAALATPAPVFAADSSELLIRQGVELRRRGRDADALPKLQSAYELSRTPRAAAQLGLCEQALKRWSDAEQHLSEALFSESDAWVQRNREVLEDARSTVRQNLVGLELTVTPDSALVSINGALLGRASDVGNVWIAPGPVSVSASLDGYVPTSVERTGHAGEALRVSLELATPVAPPSATETSAQPAEGLAATASAPGRDRDSAGSGSGHWKPYVGWSLVGLGALGLGWGALSYSDREAAAKDFNDDSNGCFVAPGGTITGGSACEALDQDIASATSRMTIGLIGGALLAGGGAALLLFSSNSEPSSTMAAGMGPNCAPSAGLGKAGGSSLGVWCGGRF
ncbi:MAG: tetratricopeptide repeat protein [Myxococcales bacterium]|nr:tetratricopeptide repeat protein [Myxococcales bacterium]